MRALHPFRFVSEIVMYVVQRNGDLAKKTNDALTNRKTKLLTPFAWELLKKQFVLAKQEG
jgi:hypothetical protein